MQEDSKLYLNQNNAFFHHLTKNMMSDFCKLDVATSRSLFRPTCSTTCHFKFKQLRALCSTKLHLWHPLNCISFLNCISCIDLSKRCSEGTCLMVHMSSVLSLDSGLMVDCPELRSALFYSISFFFPVFTHWLPCTAVVIKWSWDNFYKAT